jgi:hypothetical protein
MISLLASDWSGPVSGHIAPYLEHGGGDVLSGAAHDVDKACFAERLRARVSLGGANRIFAGQAHITRSSVEAL